MYCIHMGSRHFRPSLLPFETMWDWQQRKHTAHTLAILHTHFTEGGNAISFSFLFNRIWALKRVALTGWCKRLKRCLVQELPETQINHWQTMKDREKKKRRREMAAFCDSCYLYRAEQRAVHWHWQMHFEEVVALGSGCTHSIICRGTWWCCSMSISGPLHFPKADVTCKYKKWLGLKVGSAGLRRICAIVKTFFIDATIDNLQPGWGEAFKVWFGSEPRQRPALIVFSYFF